MLPRIFKIGSCRFRAIASRPLEINPIKGLVVTAIAIVIVNLSGCLIVPPIEDKPYTGQALEFIQIGVTGKAEVLAYFSENFENTAPTRFGNDSVWVYTAVYSGWGFIFCGVGLPGLGCAGLGDTDYYYLVLRFSDDRIVARYDVYEGGDECQESNFCAVRNNYRGYMVLADKAADQEAKMYAAPPDRCAVYIYTTDPPRVLLPMGVYLDDVPLGLITDRSAYFWTHMSVGEHRIEIQFEDYAFGDNTRDGNASYYDKTFFDCSPNELVFLRAELETSVWSFTTTIRTEEEQIARQHISERTLALLPDSADQNK